VEGSDSLLHGFFASWVGWKEGVCVPGPALHWLRSAYSVHMGKRKEQKARSLYGKCSVLKEEVFIPLLKVSVFELQSCHR